MSGDLRKRVARLEAGLRVREERSRQRLLQALYDEQLLELERALIAGNVQALLARFTRELASRGASREMRDAFRRDVSQ